MNNLRCRSVFDILSLNKSILFRNRICGGKRVVMVSNWALLALTIEVLVKNLLLQIAWNRLRDSSSRF